MSFWLGGTALLFLISVASVISCKKSPLMTAHAAAELRHLAALKRSNPGTITLGTRTIPCAILAERGTRFEADGGQIQEQLLSLLVACTDLPASEIIDATTDATRESSFTHVETGRVYHLKTDTDAPDKSPHGIFWTLMGTQATRR